MIDKLADWVAARLTPRQMVITIAILYFIAGMLFGSILEQEL